MPYLAISISFLDPYFHGRGDEESEWPPSPMRLFSALLAGSRMCARDQLWSSDKGAAFAWLERQGPPIIVAPRAKRMAGYVFYVPDNDGDATFNRQDRLVAKQASPWHFTAGSTVHYLWALSDADLSAQRNALRILCEEARHIFALGWGIDQVVGTGCLLPNSGAETLAGVRWRAIAAPYPGQHTWRAPTNGSLADLERIHRSFLSRINGREYRRPLRLRDYDSVTYLPSTALPIRPYAVFDLPSDASPFAQVRASDVAILLRTLLCQEHNRLDFQQEFADDPDVYLCGRIDGVTPVLRFSYFALPTVGNAHSDGLIRRLMIAEPRGGDGRHARWAQERLRHQVLSHNSNAVLVEPWRPGSRTVIDRYVRPSRLWESVTPVVLPGHDDVKARHRNDESTPLKAEKLFFKALTHSGIPSVIVSDFHLQKSPFWPGSEHARNYRLPPYLQGRAIWHAQLNLRRPIPGPLALGSGRHCGLGLFVGLGD